MLVPLLDENAFRRITYPLVNWTLIALNVAIFLVLQSGLFDLIEHDPAISYGMIPVVLSGALSLPADYAIVPDWMTPLTSAFFHGSWLHLAGNMLFLWVFGDNVEDDLGHVRYLIFYLSCAVLSALAYAGTALHSSRPLIGASGAISGVAAAYLLLHPRNKVWILILLRLPLRMKAMWAIGAWIIFQGVSAGMADAGDDTAWFSHLGGLLAGALLVPLLKHRDVPLFDRTSLPLAEFEASSGGGETAR